MVRVLWGEQDSNLRRFPNGFTVRPRWPLEYLPIWLAKTTSYSLIAVANIALFFKLPNIFMPIFKSIF